MQHRNTVVDRQTLFKLASAVNDGNFKVQISCTKLYGWMLDNAPVPDGIWDEIGAALAALRAAQNRLEIFLFLLSEQP